MTIHLDREIIASAGTSDALRPGFREDLRCRQADHVTRLLEHREELRGVSTYVDFVAESVRWTA